MGALNLCIMAPSGGETFPLQQQKADRKCHQEKLQPRFLSVNPLVEDERAAKEGS